MNIGFIGAGNMSQAIAKGLLETYPSRHLYVAAPTDRNLSFFQQLGCVTCHENNYIAANCQVVFICVKPNQCELALRDVSFTNQLIISVMAGVTLEKLYRLISPKAKIIRCMPNTPMQVSSGVCCLSPGSGVPVQDTTLALELLKPACLVVKTVPESQLDAIGAVSGSGPAFVFMMVEALADGGVKMGLPRALALELASRTVQGAARMVAETGRHPAELKDAVCSPGGTTIVGVHALERGSFRGVVMSAVEETMRKSVEMSGK